VLGWPLVKPLFRQQAGRNSPCIKGGEVGPHTKNGHFKDSKKNIRMETNGSRSLGRPRLRWLDDVCDDLKEPKVRNWKELAMDRKVEVTCPKATSHKWL
jgi:hypothetical protein